MVAEVSICPRCGSPSDSRATAGLCPICLGRISVLGSFPGGFSTGPPPAPPAFGDYELIEEAGRGAMGVVYRARQRQLNRIVALKMILSGPFASDAERQRFRAEAEAAAQLDHPNIVPIHEFGECDGRQFYAMRWFEGGPLSVGVGPETAARLVATVSRAVHYAHQRGVLHRDLKPGNILLDDKGQPFVADFGLARRLDAEASLTASGSSLGTPAFMSPEQAAGEKSVTTAADIWGLGAVLYYLLAGRAPFRGRDAFEVMSQVRNGVVAPPRRWNQAVDRDLETICLKCLRKDASARYAAAAEVADDLERWARREPIHARPMSAWERARLFARRRPAVTLLSLLATLLLAAGLAGVLSQWRRAERGQGMAQARLLQLHVEKAERAIEAGDPLGTLPWMAAALAAENPASPRVASYRHFIASTLQACPLPEEIWFFDHEVRDLAFSPDGRWLAAAAGPADLLVVQLDAAGGKVAERRLPAGGKQILFSPDNRWLINGSVEASSRDGRLSVFSLPDLRASPDIPVHRKLKWVDVSRDGSLIATASADGSVEILNSATGHPLCPPLLHADRVISAEFNPAGDRLVTVSVDNLVHLWELPAGRERKRLPGASFWRAHFSPDGQQLILVSRREHTAQLCDAETLAASGPALRHDDYLQDAAFSPDGKRIATVGNDHLARLWDARTGLPTVPPLPHANEVYCLQFSADGRLLATGGVDSAARVWEVATGKPVTPWLRHAGEILSLKFSPSGRHLLTGSRDGTVRLWPLIGPSAPTRKLAGQPLPVCWTAFSEDGQLAFCCSQDRGRVWRTRDWQALTPVIQCPDVIDHARFSPDGQHLATGSRDHFVRVWQWNSAAPVAAYRHLGAMVDMAWLPDSRRILSTSEGGQLVIWRARDGQVERVLPHEFGSAHTVAASPDGRWLAGGLDGRTGLWNAATGERLWLGPAGRGGISTLLFSPDSRLLASGDDTGGVHLQRVETGQLVSPPLRHGATVRDIRFSPDSRRFVVVGDGLAARVWSSATGEPLLPPLKLPGAVVEARFSLDGRWLAVANSREFQLWDALSGVPLSSMVSGSEAMCGGAFLDRQRMAAVGESGGIIDFRMANLDWSSGRTISAMRLLSGAEVDAAGGLNPAAPAGTDSTPASRREAEATWSWLRAQLKTLSPPNP